MKINVWDRILLVLGAALVLLAGVGIVVLGCQLAPFEISADGEAFFTGRRILILLVGILVVAFGGYLAFLPRKFRYNKHDFVVQKTDNGELRIAVKAIENLVQKCIDMHEEVSVVSMKIHNGREGVTVDLNISLANNISIPLAVASLQKQIKQYLVASSGIDVREVCVSVETANSGVGGNSPYLVKAEVNGEKEAAPVKPKEKTPLHQRIFGKTDQLPELLQDETPAPIPEQPEVIPAAEVPAPAADTQEEANDE